MKTMSDFRPYAVVSVVLKIDGEVMTEIMAQPEVGEGGLGVAVVRWDDFSVSDTKDILEVIAASLTRYLNNDPGIEVLEEDSEVNPKEKPADDINWPF